MNKQKDFISLEQALEQFFSAPVPRKEFLENLEQSLYAEPKMRIHPFPQIPRQISFRPVYAFLAVSVILIITLLVVGPTNAFAALQGLIRYIPGFGLVDEKTPLRVLAEPVSVTREGVTVIVKQAVLSPEQVSITYLMKNIPAVAKPEWIVSEKGKICTPISEIRLPDGTHLEQQEGGIGGYDTDNNTQYVVKFLSIPVKDNNAILFLPCLRDTLIGRAPSNWEIPLRFVPAPSNFTLLPVDVITPSPDVSTITLSNETPGPVQAIETKEPTSTVIAGNPSGVNPLSLDKVVETEDGYIFMGQFHQVLPAPVMRIQPQILDVNGLLQGYTIPADIHSSGDYTNTIEWAYQLNTKKVAWPITIRFDAASVYCSDPQVQLTFDTGFNPQNGQIWEINRDYSLGPCKIHIDFIKRIDKGYLFRTSGNQNTNEFDPDISGAASERGNRQYPSYLETTLIFRQEPPKGLLTVSLAAYSMLPGPWQVQWQPNK